jgi:hypothetical protein
MKRREQCNLQKRAGATKKAKKERESELGKRKNGKRERGKEKREKGKEKKKPKKRGSEQKQGERDRTKK